jgi:hypothetical protein
VNLIANNSSQAVSPGEPSAMSAAAIEVLLLFAAVVLAALLFVAFSRTPLSLFIVVMVLPEFINMPRGNLLDWLSVLARTLLLLTVLALGWKIYSVLLSLKQAPRPVQPWTAEQLPGTR